MFQLVQKLMMHSLALRQKVAQKTPPLNCTGTTKQHMVIWLPWRSFRLITRIGNVSNTTLKMLDRELIDNTRLIRQETKFLPSRVKCT